MSTTSDEKKKANKRKELLSQNLYVPPEVQKKHTGRPMIHPTITCTMNPTQPARKHLLKNGLTVDLALLKK